MTSVWTPEAEQMLREKWRSHSAGEISRLLASSIGAHHSRDAVIGKAWRLGIEKGGDQRSWQRSANRRLTAKIRARRMRATEGSASMAMMPGEEKRVRRWARSQAVIKGVGTDWLDLPPRACCWPVAGHPFNGPVATHACGARCDEKQRYCRAHTAMSMAQSKKEVEDA